MQKDFLAYPHGHICLPGVQVTAFLVIEIHSSCIDDRNDVHINEEVILQRSRLQQSVNPLVLDACECLP